MSEFDIYVKNVKREVDSLEDVTKGLKHSIDEIEKIKRKVARLKGCGNIESAIGNLITQLEQEKTDSKELANALEQIVKEYEKAEQKITNDD